MVFVAFQPLSTKDHQRIQNETEFKKRRMARRRRRRRQ